MHVPSSSSRRGGAASNGSGPSSTVEMDMVLNSVVIARENARINCTGNYADIINEYEHILKCSIRMGSQVEDSTARFFSFINYTINIFESINTY